MSDYDCRHRVTCAHCGVVILSVDALIVTKHTDGDDITISFCGEWCGNAYYLEKLRGGGL